MDGSPAPVRSVPFAFKVLVAGPFGVGKSTLVSTISDIRPMRAEEIVDPTVDPRSAAGAPVTAGSRYGRTVAMDFGRLTLADDILLYLFGTPRQQRHWFLWDELALGALGAVVLADTRRPADSFPSVDYFAGRGTPFLVAVNCFGALQAGGSGQSGGAVRHALHLPEGVPVLFCDARDRACAKQVLVALVEHVLVRRRANAAARRPPAPRPG